MLTVEAERMAMKWLLYGVMGGMLLGILVAECVR